MSEPGNTQPDPQSVAKMIVEGMTLAQEEHNKGNLDPAEKMYRQVLELMPNHAEARNLLGVVALQRGNSSRGIRELRKALELDDNKPAFHHNIASGYLMRQQYIEAEKHLMRAIELYDAADWSVFNMLAETYRMQGKFEDAAHTYIEVMKLAPERPESFNDLGGSLVFLEKYDDAQSVYEQGLAQHPNHPLIRLNMASLARIRRAHGEAVKILKALAKEFPEDINVLRELAGALKDMDDLDNAEIYADRALALLPNNPDLLDLRGNIRLAHTDIDGAISAYRSAISAASDHALSHAHLGMALLTKGDFAEGWQEFSWRWRSPAFTSTLPNFGKPAWDGSDLNGKTILLHAEQGIGDAIQFVRYVDLLASKGAKVRVLCQDPLKRLFNGLPGAASVSGRSEAVQNDFDYTVGMMDVPQILKTDLDSIPADVPYLQPDPTDVKRLAADLPDGVDLKVGLVWRGNPEFTEDLKRSIGLAPFKELFDIDGVTWVSLQKEPAEGDKPYPEQLIDPTDQLKDFADTAALIESLDLVISIDSAVLHLAGALNKPVWGLIPHAPDFRWMLNRDDSPWYPSLRLFRQPKRGDWDSVIQAVAEALREKVSA